MNEARSTQPACSNCGHPLTDSGAGICFKCSADRTVAPGSASSIREARTIPSADKNPGEHNLFELGASGRIENEKQGLERYENREVIGRWEHGPVCQAHHPGLDRTVLIRLLEFDQNEASGIRDEFIQRAKAISKLNHPNTVSTMEAGFDDRVAFIVQEKVEGDPVSGFHRRSAKQRRQEGFFPGQRLAHLLHSAVVALEAIHEQGIAHGNLSAESFVMERHGILKIVGLIEPIGPSPTIEVDDSDLFQADIKQLGAAFYKITSGNELQPYVLANSTAEIARHIKRQNPGLQKSICTILARCITPQVDAYTNVKPLIADLVGPASGATTRASWRTRVISMLIGGVILGFALVAVLGRWVAAWFPESFDNGMGVFSIGLGGLIVYSITMETAFGFTPIRRLFGLKLFDHSGEEAHAIRRFVRSSLRFAIIFFALIATALLLPLYAKIGGVAGSLMGLATVLVFFPLWVLYLPSLFNKSRWTPYDLWAGTTWGESNSQKQQSVAQAGSDAIANLPLGDSIDRIDQYQIFSSLGAGGMGKVYLAYDQTLQRNVAIKVVAGYLVGDSETRGRFQREARLAAKISHPNVARVFGDGIWNGAPYIAMELVDGKDLHETVEANGPLHLDTAWHCIIQAAEALQAAAKLGVIHRDIKPANLMLTPDSNIKVMDFGVSREIHSDVDVTKAGEVIGTPTYMSPEQAMGNQVDFRSDIYSLGLTLYFLLAGRPPFGGNNSMQILAQKMESAPKQLLGEVAGLTPDQQRVIDKMIAKKPDDRFADYGSLLIELRRNFTGDQQFGNIAKRLAAEFCNFFTFYLLGLVCVLFGVAVIDQNNPSPIFPTISFLMIEGLFVGMYVWGIGAKGQTSGKKLLGLKVTRTSGQPVGFARALLRFIVAYPAFVVLPVGPIAAIFGNPDVELYYFPQAMLILNGITLIVSIVLMKVHPCGRTLHDLSADTVVHRTKK